MSFRAKLATTPTRRGTPRAKPAEPRFWLKVAKAGDDDCWLWMGRISGDGYGHFFVAGKPITAHRFSARLHGADIEGRIVRHTCDGRYKQGDITYRRCVNPAHLVTGTDMENSLDCRARGRHPKAKLSLGAADEIRAQLARGATVEELAAKHGVSWYTIYFVKAGRSWVTDKPKTGQVRKRGCRKLMHAGWRKCDDGLLQCKKCGDFWDGTSEKTPGCRIRLIRADAIPAGSWTIERHGGKAKDRWLPCGWGNEAEVRAAFVELGTGVRQGGLRILNPRGDVVHEKQIPVARPNAFKRKASS